MLPEEHALQDPVAMPGTATGIVAKGHAGEHAPATDLLRVARATFRWFALQRPEFSRWTCRRTLLCKATSDLSPAGEICVAVIAWIMRNLKIWAEKSTCSEMLEKSIGEEIDVLPDRSKSG